jgi:hypothetical protein
MENEKKRGSRELFMLDEKGEPTDAALHEEILDNPVAKRAIAHAAIARAMARGMSRSDAEKLYGVDG